ncbi:MAG: restriction endonuclease subunit S [Planctomycetota bacterium]
MARFDRIALGELITLKRGYDLPARLRRAGPVPVVSSCGVTGRHDRARVEGPGVVTGRTGTLGGVYFLEEDFWPLNTTLYVEDFKNNHPRFVSYLLRTIDYRRHNDKAAIPGVSRGHLHGLTVARPPRRRQRAIAKALASLDRRLALLSRADRALADTATELFRLLPRGRPRRVAELCDAVGNGGTPHRRERAYWQAGTVPWFRSGELRDGPLVRAAEAITERGLAESACRRWPAGTVLVAMYASPTVGRLGVLQEPAAANQACCALVPRAEFGSWFLFHALLATRARLQHLAGGAAQQNISQRIVVEHDIGVPRPALARAFHGRVAPLHALRAAHAREARALARLRDALLTELLAGRIAPSDLRPRGRPSRSGGA